MGIPSLRRSLADLIEHDGEGLRDLSLFDRRLCWGGCFAISRSAFFLNEHIAEDGLVVFATVAGLVPGILSKKLDGTYRSNHCPAWIKVGNPAGIATQRTTARIGMDEDRQALPWNGRWLCQRTLGAERPMGVCTKAGAGWAGAQSFCEGPVERYAQLARAAARR